MNIEELLHQTADQMVYPPAPEIRLSLGKTANPLRLRLQWGITMLVAILLAASLIAIPPVRAALVEIFRIGGITIQVSDTQPDDALPLLLDRANGRVTLQKAQSLVDFPIRLPAEWGMPDEVYLQDWNGDVVITLWRDPEQPNRIALALYHFESEMMGVYKMAEKIEETEVHGERAFWIEHPHTLSLSDTRRPPQIYLVSGAVLIWEVDGVTYRLESGLNLEKAIQVAESVE